MVLSAFSAPSAVKNVCAGKSIREQQGGVVAQRPVQIIQQLVAAGRLGQKSGRGFYEYRSKE